MAGELGDERTPLLAGDDDQLDQLFVRSDQLHSVSLTASYRNQHRYNIQGTDSDPTCLDRPQQTGRNAKTGCKCGPCIPSRYLLCVMSCWGLTNIMAVRFSLDIALGSMVNYTHQQVWNTTDTCPQVANTTNIEPRKGEFDWDLSTQSTVLAAFFYGYPFLQLPGGYLAEKYGSKLVFGVSIFLAGVCTLLSPIAARWNPTVLIILRILLGLVSGAVFPAHHVLWSQWAPPPERGKLIGCSFSGIHLGLLLSLVTVLFCESSLLDGWPLSFYFFGVVTCVWFCLWLLLTSDKPGSHPRISPSELEYIHASTQQIHQVTYESPDWLLMLRSAKVWALVITQWCNEMALYAIVHCSALYFKQLFHLTITQICMILVPAFSIPVVFTCGGGMLADHMINRGIRVGVTRKVITFVALGLSGISMFALGMVDCDLWPAVILLVTSISIDSLKTGGYLINHLDVAPVYAGSVFGVSNSLASTSAFIMPQILHSITHGQPNRRGWCSFFVLAGAFSVGGALVFAVYGTGKEQHWAKRRSSYQPVSNQSAPSLDDMQDYSRALS